MGLNGPSCRINEEDAERSVILSLLLTPRREKAVKFNISPRRLASEDENRRRALIQSSDYQTC